MTYKIGDKVLVEMTVSDTTSLPSYCVQPIPGQPGIWVYETSIHGPAPAVDWSDPALMGRRVIAWNVRDGEHTKGRLVCAANNGRRCILPDDYPGPLWFSECELLGDDK